MLARFHGQDSRCLDPDQAYTATTPDGVLRASIS